MKIAIPIYGDTVSNVFDFARRLLLVDVENGQEIHRSEIMIENRVLAHRAAQLRDLGAEVLVCGAISQELAAMVVSYGIKVQAFITGNVEDILAAYRAGKLITQEFGMPGCPFRVGRGPRRGRRGCRWQGGPW